MSTQLKFTECFNKSFWKDLPTAISYLCRDLILGSNLGVTRIASELRKAGVQRCSENLLYARGDPEKEQLPSLKAFLLLIKITENCQPIEEINAACGKHSLPAEEYEQVVSAWSVMGRVLNGKG